MKEVELPPHELGLFFSAHTNPAWWPEPSEYGLTGRTVLQSLDAFAPDKDFSPEDEQPTPIERHTVNMAKASVLAADFIRVSYTEWKDKTVILRA